MMTRHNPMISILIVNYNGLAHLDECLDSVFKQDYPHFEVVMVDNGSKDGSVERVETAYPRVKTLRAGKNLGFADGNNFGLPHCKGDFIFFLNNDTRMEAGALGELARSIEAHPEEHVFACFLLNYYQPELADSAGDSIYRTGAVFSFRGYPASDFSEPRFVASACAGAAVFSREALADIGGFDGDFFLIFEDVDLSLRARHRGYRILFLPSVKIRHKSSASLGGKKSALAIYYCERNFLPLLVKDFPLSSILRMLPALIILKCVRGIKAARGGNLRAFLRGTFGALSLVPKMIGKRKGILSASRLTVPEFHSSLRKNWIAERRAFRRGDFKIPH